MGYFTRQARATAMRLRLANSGRVFTSVVGFISVAVMTNVATDKDWGAKRGLHVRVIKPSIQYFAGFKEVLKASLIDNCNASRPRLHQLGGARVSSSNQEHQPLGY